MIHRSPYWTWQYVISGLGKVDSRGDMVEEGQSRYWMSSLLSEAWVTVHTQTKILPVANRGDIIAFVSFGRTVMMLRL